MPNKRIMTTPTKRQEKPTRRRRIALAGVLLCILMASMYAASDPANTQPKAMHPSASMEEDTRAYAGAASSPDGSHIATASPDGTLRVWKAASGELQHTLKGHTGPILDIAFSTDGTLIASASSDGTARLWATASGQGTHILKGHAGRVWSVAFSPDGTRLITASSDGTARIWTAADGKQLQVLNEHLGIAVDDAALARVTQETPVNRDPATLAEHAVADIFRRATFSSDGTHIVTDSRDGTVQIWHAPSEKLIYVLSSHDETPAAATSTSAHKEYARQTPVESGTESAERLLALQKELDRVRQEAEQDRQKLEELIILREQLASELQGSKAALTQTQTELQDTKSQLHERDQTLEQLEQQLAEHDAAQRALSKKLTTLTAERDRLATDRAQLNAALTEANHSLSRSELTAAQVELAAVNKQIATADRKDKQDDKPPALALETQTSESDIPSPVHSNSKKIGSERCCSPDAMIEARQTGSPPSSEVDTNLSADALRTIQHWSRAWSNKDVAGYLAFYDEEFQPLRGMSHEAWRALRHKRLSAPKFIQVTITDPRVESVRPDKVLVTFRQAYSADHYQDESVKRLELIKRGGQWRIIKEESGEISAD